MNLGKYSFGVGDRFGHEGKAQLRAIIRAGHEGVEITPVWNKSNREHDIVKSVPADTRKEADSAVKHLGWTGPYFVDADHINMQNIDRFIEPSDFFTIDVAGYIGRPSPDAEVEAFKKSWQPADGELLIPGIPESLKITGSLLEEVSSKYLAAVKEAGRIYRHIESRKGAGRFITEVSMDEVAVPQTPVDLLFILKMLSDEGIPVRTIAPRFSGRFNKGVDYQGDPEQFAREFEQDVLVIDYAVKTYGLPDDLKLSIHSGSDKFSIYPVMGRIIKKYNKGIHVKTAGTTWLEEVTGLAVAGGEGLNMAKAIYKEAHARREELCTPYADVIDIDESFLPMPYEVDEWSSDKFVHTLRHIPGNPGYNPHVRQLIHVGYKVAAERKDQFTGLLKKYAPFIGNCVETNLYERHLKRLFNL